MRTVSGLVLALGLILSVGASAEETTLASLSDAPMTPRPATGERLAGFCIEPIKPIQSIKPYWCSGVWTQILECTPKCQCVWREVCLQ